MVWEPKILIHWLSEFHYEAAASIHNRYEFAINNFLKLQQVTLNLHNIQSNNLPCFNRSFCIVSQIIRTREVWQKMWFYLWKKLESLYLSKSLWRFFGYRMESTKTLYQNLNCFLNIWLDIMIIGEKLDGKNQIVIVLSF